MRKRIGNLLCVLLLSGPAFAEPPDAVLPEVVVTASRWEEPVESVPQDVTIITRADIEKKGVPFVVDLLRFQPDLQVVQNGGPGTVATLLMRGGESDQVLVLVDGFKFNNPTTGSADLSSLLTTDIERIEIIKGPQSTLYGSEAIAGVVNIITKKGAGKLKADLSVEGGSFNTVKTSGTISGGRTERITAFPQPSSTRMVSPLPKTARCLTAIRISRCQPGSARTQPIIHPSSLICGTGQTRRISTITSLVSGRWTP